MQGKTDYLPKNFCIRAYQLSSYWFVLRNSYMRTPMETPSFYSYNVCEEVNRFVNWIFKVYSLFLISSTKEHEHLGFTSAKATNSKIFGCIGFGSMQASQHGSMAVRQHGSMAVWQVHARLFLTISNKGLKTTLHARDLVDFCHTLEEAKW